MYIARTWAPLGWPCLPTRCAITGTDHDLVFPLHYHIEDVSTVKIGLCGYHFPIDDIIIAAMKVWVNSIGADFYEHGIQALVHRWWKCIASSGDWWKTASYSWEFSLSNNVLVFFVSVVVSMDTNRRHYFWGNLPNYKPVTFTNKSKTYQLKNQQQTNKNHLCTGLGFVLLRKKSYFFPPLWEMYPFKMFINNSVSPTF